MNRRTIAVATALSVVSLLLVAQFAQLLALMVQTGSATPGRDFLLAFTAVAGFAAAVGVATTGRLVLATRASAS